MRHSSALAPVWALLALVLASCEDQQEFRCDCTLSATSPLNPFDPGYSRDFHGTVFGRDVDNANSKARSQCYEHSDVRYHNVCTCSCNPVVDASVPATDAARPIDAAVPRADAGVLTCRMDQPRQLQSRTACLYLGSEGERVALRLTQFWQVSPTHLCAYVAGTAFSSCASPLPAMNASFCPADDSISWDTDYMNSMFAERGSFAPAMFLAHEWGHVVQRRAGVQPPVSDKPTELQADCLAGVFAAREQAVGVLGAMDVMVAWDAFCSWGDPFTSPWFAQGPHGTCFERRSAFIRGYEQGRACVGTLCTQAPTSTALTICSSSGPLACWNGS